MATYTMTIDERTTQGKDVLNYLRTRKIKLLPVPVGFAPCQFTKDEMRTILAESVAEARSGQGTLHEDFKREMASWL